MLKPGYITSLKYPWLLYAFLCDLLFDLAASINGWENARFISKPLLMILLLIFVMLQNISPKQPKLLLICGLLFSLGGDVFLQLERYNSIYFIIGLTSFLIAHIFYIILFFALRKLAAATFRWKWWIAIILVLYAGLLLFTLLPYLGDLKIPVLIYALVISTMLFAALHIDNNKQTPGYYLIIVGATLFVLSDSVLAINKFYAPFRLGGLIIMTTYGLAQLLICTGVIKFIYSRDKP